MARILVVDDEPEILRFVERALRGDGHEVTIAHDGLSGLQAACATPPPDLVVLDLLLPRLDGRAALAAMLMHTPNLRVIVLSAVGDVRAKVGCLEAGAADYLAKPFAVAELLARVRSRLRDRVATAGSEVLRVGDVRLDLRNRTVTVSGRKVPLSEREFLVTQHLMRRAGQVCTREELLSDIWGYSYDPGSNVVDVYVARVRAKLHDELIATVRNVGYTFASA
ncbi:MAG: two-component system, OmpR family, response regulator [Actinomycetota bacterium]|jgi:DNA-binding response OmpR family regulator|nr:two-component system, OmpR family, response regulator [Actinomycetota bacterium]MDQ1494978.1 two-component system, OmpR family, response regulator [Actinomycetota bacterium]MDQ1540240.1 two-component system, OmpR family, response regulator [Actinomycetota bacterium]